MYEDGRRQTADGQSRLGLIGGKPGFGPSADGE
jgi:hypothetical protein